MKSSLACVCVLALGLFVVANDGAMIPQWPKQFTSFWRTALVLFDEITSSPPWNVLPNATSGATFHSFTGSTFYDFTGTTKKMFQRFPSIAFSGKGCPYSPFITCAVLNLDNVAYAWQLDPKPHSCCIEAHVGVLPPTFPTNGERLPDTPFHGSPAAWWAVGQVGTGFAYNKNTTAGTSWSVAHYGTHIFSPEPLWRWLEYDTWDTSVPDQSVFELPDICKNAPECPLLTPPKEIKSMIMTRP